MRYIFTRFPYVFSVILLLMSHYGHSDAADLQQASSSEEATAKDLATWRELFTKGDYEALDKIANDLRTTNAKYPNGRGRLWRFCWTATPVQKPAKDEEYEHSLQSLDKWLAARPKSINVRLLLAKVWFDYAAAGRGGRFAEYTPEAQLKLYAERSAKASKYLDEIEGLAKNVDNGYRRLRIDTSKGLGEKPDVKLVYDGLKADPLNMELVHGMAICLLPRWFGDEGELEKFADEVVRRTKDQCGEMHYTTAAIATKEYLKSYTLDTHKFVWSRLQRGFRDVEKKYPGLRENLDDEAQFAYMAGDLDAVYSLLAKIGDHPRLESWRVTEIHFEEFRPRMKPEMMRGDQKRLLLGTTRPVLAVESFGDGKLVASANWDAMVRMHDLASGERRGWIYLQGINGVSVHVSPKTGLLAAGTDNDPGMVLLNLSNGQSGRLAPSKAKVMTTVFSSKGDLLAAADEQGLVVVYDLKTGKPKHTFAADEKREITDMAFSAEGTQLAASCGSGDLLVFNLIDDKLETTRKLSEHALTSITWTEPQFAVGSARGEVTVLQGPTGDQIATWKTEPLEVASLAFSPDGEKLAIGVRHVIGPKQNQNWDTPVAAPLWVWKYRKDKLPTPLVGHKLGVNCVRFTDRGKTLISGSHDWTIRVWDVP